MGSHCDQRKSIARLSQQVSDSSRRNSSDENALRSSTSQRLARDGQAFERSHDRKSERARSGNSVTNNHLILNEDEQLDEDPGDIANSSPCSTSTASPISNRNMTSISDHPNQRSSSSQKTNKKSTRFEPTFLEDLNRALAASPQVATIMQSQQTYDFQQETKESKRPRKKYGKHMVPLYNQVRSGDVASSGDSRGKFRQSYTELSSPMKTSPAFEYILRDTERRNKRYCLWFIYSILMIICVALMIFAIVHLVLRQQSSPL